MTLKNTLALIVLLLASASVNAQQRTDRIRKQFIVGLPFDEVTVSSDLKVSRLSKENRQGKALSANEDLRPKTLPSESSSFISSSPRILHTVSRPERRKKRSNSKATLNKQSDDYDNNKKRYVNKRKDKKSKELVDKKQKLMIDKLNE